MKQRLLSALSAAGLVLAGLTVAVPAHAAESEIDAALGPCNVAPQIRVTTGSNAAGKYWYNIQNCFSTTQRLNMATDGWFGDVWGTCTSVKPGASLGRSMSDVPLKKWKYC